MITTSALKSRHIPRQRDRGPRVGRAGAAHACAVREEREYEERAAQALLVLVPALINALVSAMASAMASALVSAMASALVSALV